MKKKRERQYQKEKETFTKWIKEQWKEVEKDMKKRLKATAEHICKLTSKPPTIFEEEEGEALGTAANRLARWASQIPSSENPTIPPSPRQPSIPHSPPPRAKSSEALLWRYRNTKVRRFCITFHVTILQLII
jgi:hypothetical protein